MVQAVATARFGPVILKAMDKWPLTRLMMLPGMKNGDTFFGEWVSEKLVVGFLDGFEAAHAGTHEDADAIGIGLGDHETRNRAWPACRRPRRTA